MYQLIEKMRINKFSILTLFICISFFCNAQKIVEVNYSDSSTLVLNGILLTKNTDVRNVIKNIGDASKIVGYPNGERNFFYEEYGLLLMTKDTVLTGLGINFNWDGDKKFPITSYTGHLEIGKLKIDKKTKREEINSIKPIEFGCPMDILCASKSRTSSVRCTIAFKSDSLTQIVFLLK